ncbi:hypothetical protein TYRP_002969 [Tyrophagus putrescentiae]|nr:hypothetical protein TYRP_002969 [Tyrophagus putrescentiae]
MMCFSSCFIICLVEVDVVVVEGRPVEAEEGPVRLVHVHVASGVDALHLGGAHLLLFSLALVGAHQSGEGVPGDDQSALVEAPKASRHRRRRLH